MWQGSFHRGRMRTVSKCRDRRGAQVGADLPDFAYPIADRAAYSSADPFPHAAFRNAWDDELLHACKDEISSFADWEGEKAFYGASKKRYCGDFSRLPLSVRRVITEASQPRFLQWLQDLTGEKSLVPDPYLKGGGIHQIAAGGFLKVHADFNWNEQLNLYRRLNILIYLNDGWDESWGGALELWTSDMKQCGKRIYPFGNTMVVFTTHDHSFHGHPHPLATPSGVYRDSIALYYYSPLKPEEHFAATRLSTDYRPIDGDEFKRGGMTWLQRSLIRTKR